MFQIFNYNSRKFTILAICFLCGLLYFSEKNNNRPIKTPNAEGAKYTLELDPATLGKDQTFYQKVLFFLFNDQIKNSVENKKATKFNDTLNNNFNNLDGYKIKSGDKVSIVYYQTNPLPSIAPKSIQVIVGNNNLPSQIDLSLIGMKTNDKKEVIIGDNFYNIIILSVD